MNRSISQYFNKENSKLHSLPTLYNVKDSKNCKKLKLNVIGNIAFFIIPMITGFPGGSVPASAKTGVWSLGWEDSLEKEMATHSSVLAWEVSWTEEPGRVQSTRSQESDMA